MAVGQGRGRGQVCIAPPSRPLSLEGETGQQSDNQPAVPIWVLGKRGLDQGTQGAPRSRATGRLPGPTGRLALLLLGPPP